MIKEKILVVEDNLVNLKLLYRMLKKTGYEVISARNGKEACEIAVESKPDMILLDIMMPLMDGYATCKWLKKNKNTAEIPVIFLTANNDPIDKVKGFSLDAIDYITKPFDTAEVVARVNNHLKLSRMRRQIIQKNKQLEKAFGQLRESNEKIKKDIKAAGLVQKKLLPPDTLNFDTIKIAWKFVPSSHIAGDIFNIMPLDEKHIALYIVDVSGHGVQAAMLAVLIHNFLRFGMDARSIKEKAGHQLTIEKLLQPSDVMHALNQNFPMEIYDAYFTCIYGVLNHESLEFTWANAGHPVPLVIHKNKSVEFLVEADIPIGILKDTIYKSKSYNFTKGDSLVLYTDGIYELNVKDGIQLDKNVLANIINKGVGDLNEKFIYTVDKILKMSVNSKFEDDVSLFGLEINQ